MRCELTLIFPTHNRGGFNMRTSTTPNKFINIAMCEVMQLGAGISDTGDHDAVAEPEKIPQGIGCIVLCMVRDGVGRLAIHSGTDDYRALEIDADGVITLLPGRNEPKVTLPDSFIGSRAHNLFTIYDFPPAFAAMLMMTLTLVEARYELVSEVGAGRQAA